MRGSAPQTTASWSSASGLATGDRSGGATVWDARAARALGDSRGRIADISRRSRGSRQPGRDRSGTPRGTRSPPGARTARFDSATLAAIPSVPDRSVPAHVSEDVPGAAGAVGDIDQTADGRVVSVGADGKLAVLDPRRGFDVVAKIPLGDFAYSLAVAGT